MPERKITGKSNLSNCKRILEMLIANSGEEPLDLAISALAFFYKNDAPSKFEKLKKLVSQSSFSEYETFSESIKKDLKRILQNNLSKNENTNSEFLHVLFQVLSAEFAKSDKGQFFTPSGIANFCVESLNLVNGMSVCDLACGGGIFLHQAAYKAKKLDIKCDFFGFDISERSIKIAKSISIINSTDFIYFEKRDSLKMLHSNKEKIQNSHDYNFDIIITNPPFAGDVGSEYYEYNYQFCNANKISEKDIYFLELCLKKLNNKGQLVIILPDNKFSSKKFEYIREFILDNIFLKAVISLHPNTFRPFTQQKASILFASKDINAPKNVLFIKSESSGKLSNGKPSNQKDDFQEISRSIKQIFK